MTQDAPFPRRRQPELMDDPALDAAIHRQALTGLRRVNWWSRTDSVIWNAVQTIGHISSRPHLRILDIGSGGGDLAIRLARRFQRERVNCEIVGWDISPDAVQFASEQAAAAGLRNVTFQIRNALAAPDPEQKFDVVMCSLFLHHLDSPEAVALLRTMKALSRGLVLVDDLRRTRLGYWLAWLGCRILTTCHVVHVDGPMSVEGAFSTPEVRDLAVRAGLAPCVIRHHWPQRFLLSARLVSDNVD